ncbi:MAG: ABC transporter ATP-binding protein [Magnetovibrionaceae bacterium]
MASLVIEGLRRPGLAPVNLALGPGGIAVLQGPSGSGKSLFLRALADLDPSEGLVLLDERPRESFSAPEWRARVGYLAPRAAWWRETVGAHFPGPQSESRARELFRAFGLEGQAWYWPVSRLSTGEAQRLQLARLLFNEPAVLLLDEPTSGLDPEATEAVEAELMARAASGCLILLVSHDGAQAARLGSRLGTQPGSQPGPSRGHRRLRIEKGEIREEEPS